MSDTKPIKLSQLIDVIDTPSDMECSHYFDRQTGDVVMVSGEDRDAEKWYDEETDAGLAGRCGGAVEAD